MRVIENGRMTEKVTYDPLGLILNISAWNYPYFVGSNVWIPALLTGSTIMYKPSEIAIQTGQHIERLMHASGIPEEAFTLITGKAAVASIGTNSLYYSRSCTHIDFSNHNTNGCSIFHWFIPSWQEHCQEGWITNDEISS